MTLQGARTQNNLGIVQLIFADHDSKYRVNDANDWFSRSLDEFDEHRNPDDWATALVNLGIAHWVSSDESHKEGYLRAREAFEGALRVYTRERSPQQWATIQCHLGNLYAGPLSDGTVEMERK